MRIFFKILLWFFLAIFLLTGGLSLYIYTHSDEIKKEALHQINLYLKAPVQVGSIEITWWKYFPEVSLQLNKVKILSVPASPGGAALLDCQEIGVGFNLWDIYHKDYRFKSIYIQDGKVCGYQDAEGKVNYHILKDDTTHASGSRVSIQLKTVKIQRVKFEWYTPDVMTHYFIDRASFSGNFNAARFDLKADISGELQTMKASEYVHESKDPIAIHAEVSADQQHGVYTFKHGSIKSHELELSLSGQVKHDSIWYTDLRLSQKSCQLESLVRWFPAAFKEQLKSYKPEGMIGIDIHAKGALSANSKPELRFEGDLKDGSFTDQSQDRSFKHLGCNIRGVWPANGAMGSLYIEHLKGSTGSIIGEGHLRYESGWWTGAFLVQGEMKDMNPFLSGAVKFKKGWFDADVALSGTTEDFRKGKASDINIKKFAVHIDSTDFNWGANQIEGISLHAQLTGNDIHLGNLDCRVNEAPVHVEAEVANFLPWMLGHGQPKIQAEVQFGHLELKSFTSTDSSAAGFGLPEIRLRFNGEEFIYGKHRIIQPRLKLEIFDGLVMVPEAHAEIYGGSIDVEALRYDSRLRKLVFKADVKRIQLKEMFVGLDNFGQSVLTDKHIEGRFSAKSIKASVPLHADGKPDYKNLLLESEMLIEEGRLQGFEPIYAMSKFIKIDELKDIRFAELKNKISIHDNRIYIPDMQIRNSALNLQMSGMHSFDNVLDYHLKILLKEVLLKKRKQRTSDEFGSYEPTADQGMNVYIYIQGPMGQLKIGYDRKQAREGTKQRLKEEQQQVKEIFKREGKLFRRDATLNPTTKDSIPPDEIKWDEGD